MTARDKSGLLGEISTRIANNTEGDISAADVRSVLNDLVDSTLNNVETSEQTIAGGAITGDSLITLVHGIKSDYGRNGTFVFNRSTLAAIRKLKDTAGQYVFQAGMSLQGGVTNTILGQPYVEATDMASIAQNAFPVAYGDFRRAYMIVDRVSLAVLRDPFTQATTGNVRYIARRRVGGQVVLPEAITKLKVTA